LAGLILKFDKLVGQFLELLSLAAFIFIGIVFGVRISSLEKFAAIRAAAAGVVATMIKDEPCGESEKHQSHAWLAKHQEHYRARLYPAQRFAGI
jgi:hypothetical protein